MKKVILGDANFSCLPILRSLKVSGYKTITVGEKSSDPCHSLSDVAIAVNYSNYSDFENVVIETGVSSLVSGCNDASYIACAEVANKLGLIGYDTMNVVKLIHNKGAFKQFAISKGYPVSKSTEHYDDALNYSFPLLFKPSVSFSGKGIIKFDTQDELSSYKNNVVIKNGIFEEFKEGQLYSHSVFIKNGKILIDFFVKEYCTVYPYQVNSSCIALDVSEDLKNIARLWLIQFVDDLSLVDGLIHTQFISDGTSFTILEVCRRCPGDLYSTLISKSSGIDYASLYVAGFLGQMPDNITYTQNTAYITRHTVSTNSQNIYLGCALNKSFRNAVFYPLKSTGCLLSSAPYDKAGIYFVEHYNEDDMLSQTPEMKNVVDIELLNIEAMQ